MGRNRFPHRGGGSRFCLRVGDVGWSFHLIADRVGASPLSPPYFSIFRRSARGFVFEEKWRMMMATRVDVASQTSNRIVCERFWRLLSFFFFIFFQGVELMGWLSRSIGHFRLLVRSRFVHEFNFWFEHLEYISAWYFRSEETIYIFGLQKMERETGQPCTVYVVTQFCNYCPLPASFPRFSWIADNRAKILATIVGSNE